MPDEPGDLTELLAEEGRFASSERALRSLGDKCLDLLKRFYLLKEPLQQIASAIGLAGEGAAKTRKYKCLEEARRRYRELLSRDTGQPIERIARDFDRDLFMTPEQAREYGIIDEILSRDELGTNRAPSNR